MQDKMVINLKTREYLFYVVKKNKNLNGFRGYKK